MNNYLSDQAIQPVVKQRFAYHLRSKVGERKGVLLITGYDYFLNKGDFKRLLNTYKEVILVPRSVNNDHLLHYTIRTLLARQTSLHLVTNPAYDGQHQLVYELVIRQSRSIQVRHNQRFLSQSVGQRVHPFGSN